MPRNTHVGPNRGSPKGPRTGRHGELPPERAQDVRPRGGVPAGQQYHWGAMVLYALHGVENKNTIKTIKLVGTHALHNPHRDKTCHIHSIKCLIHLLGHGAAPNLQVSVGALLRTPRAARSGVFCQGHGSESAPLRLEVVHKMQSHCCK